ncbi:AHH domain-containing protein [Pyxidicoccus sp. 3LG]
MSQKRHNWDAKNLEGKHKPIQGSTDGGACLNSHSAGRDRPGPDGVLLEHSCNYRWQGFKRALDEPRSYNWPRYKSLSEELSRRPSMVLLARTVGSKMKVAAPKQGDWDVGEGGKNFRTSCNVPYWHEAHHIIPDSILSASIAGLGEGTPQKTEYKKMARGGLLDEHYNLNHKLNLILLPMDETISMTLGLPRHRITADVFSHSAYSDKVKRMVDEALRPVQKKLQKHEAPDYKACKGDLEGISRKLYPLIVLAGKLIKKGRLKGGALEQLPGELFGEKPPASSANLLL